MHERTHLPPLVALARRKGTRAPFLAFAEASQQRLRRRETSVRRVWSAGERSLLPPLRRGVWLPVVHGVDGAAEAESGAAPDPSAARREEKYYIYSANPCAAGAGRVPNPYCRALTVFGWGTIRRCHINAQNAHNNNDNNEVPAHNGPIFVVRSRSQRMCGFPSA